MDKSMTTLTANEIGLCLGGMSMSGVYKNLITHDIHSETINNRKIIPPLSVRKLLQTKGYQYPKLNLAFQMIKGGVGKTSFAFNSAVRASHYGAKVLAIDFDMQANLTSSLRVNAIKNPVWINIFRDKVLAKDAIINISETLDLIPSNLNNSRLDIELITSNNTNLRDMIRDSIAPIRDNYDLIIMDCPTAINKINTAVTCASDMVCIPMNPDEFALEGLDITLNYLQEVAKTFKLNNDFRIIWNKYDAREKNAPFYLHSLARREDLIGKILTIICRVDASFKNASNEKISIFDLPKKTPIRQDMDEVIRELLGFNAWLNSK